MERRGEGRGARGQSVKSAPKLFPFLCLTPLASPCHKSSCTNASKHTICRREREGGSFKSAPKLCRHLASPHPSTHLSWIVLTFWSQESTGLQGSPKAQHYSKHKFPNVGHLAFEGYPPSQTLFASDLATLQIAQTCA